MESVTTKRILFICPAFFGYEISVKNALIENGYEVDYFDERTSNSSFLKAISRVNKNLLAFSIKKYYSGIWKRIRHIEYDFFLLIKGEVVPEDFILKVKNKNNHIKLIYYTYDSRNNNNKHSLNILKYFDKLYSFDFVDTENDKRFQLKHLFYSNEFQINSNISNRDFQISFVGTLHSNRYDTVKKLFSNFNNYYIFLFSPAKWWFILNKLINKKYKKISYKEVSFKKISRDVVANIFKSSYAVLDIQRNGQSGLTMRTFEVLASGAILVTTNKYIKAADFYNESNIVIVDDSDFGASINEIKNKLSQSIIRHEIDITKYHVNNWVKDFFMI
jgi:hypothetical protein